MRYVTFVFVTLLLHAGVSMAQNAPPTSIGLAEGNPSARRGSGVITGERPYNTGIRPSSPPPPSTLGAGGGMNWSAVAHPNPSPGYQGTPGGSAYTRSASSALAAAQSGATMTNGSAMTSGGAVARGSNMTNGGTMTNSSGMTSGSTMAGTSTVMPAHPNRSLPVPALTGTPVPGAPVTAAGNSKLEQAGIIIVSGKPAAAGSRLGTAAMPAPGAASALATSTASRTIDLNSAAVKSGIIIVSGKGATGIRNTGPSVPSPSVSPPAQSTPTQ